MFFTKINYLKQFYLQVTNLSVLSIEIARFGLKRKKEG